MQEKFDKLTDALIKQYAGKSSKAEIKFRNKLKNIDWNEELIKLKTNIKVMEISLIVLFSLFFILVIMIFVVIIKNNQTPNFSVGPIILNVSTLLYILSAYSSNLNKYQALKLLRVLLEK